MSAVVFVVDKKMDTYTDLRSCIFAGADRTLADLFDLTSWAKGLTGSNLASREPSSAPSESPSIAVCSFHQYVSLFLSHSMILTSFTLLYFDACLSIAIFGTFFSSERISNYRSKFISPTCVFILVSFHDTHVMYALSRRTHGVGDFRLQPRAQLKQEIRFT